MDPAIPIDEFFDGPVYALVIGISEYKNSYSENEGPTKNGFRQLKWAHKDAEDFKAYLSASGVPLNCIIDLINEQATCTEIKKGFEKLIEYYKEFLQDPLPNGQKPLIIIFFSGHGEADLRDLYFIPYDAEKNSLRATAFSKNLFDEYLNELKTDKLLVFLDACHSGGAAGNDGKGEESKFEPTALGEGKGRYVFASCGKGELSYEGEKNGIFTQHLLELLKCEGDDIIEEEEINTDNLWQKLRKEVRATAERLKKKQQNPTRKIVEDGEPIKLGLNKKIKEARLYKETLDKTKRVEFQKKLCEIASKQEFRFKTIFEARLKKYVNSGTKEKGYDTFYYLLI